MDWVELLDDWGERSVSGGYAGLHDLADSSFSGAVSAGDTWAFFVNGRVVRVLTRTERAGVLDVDDGDIEAFEDHDATAYEAPHPSVPLLVAMKHSDGDRRAKYYTEDTPLDTVAETLEGGGFTGYVELSENVLSGDYYSIYQAGRSMHLAIIGNERRLKTDEDAYDAACDEVGIYEVVAVDISVTEIPDAPGSASDTDAVAGGAGAAVAAGTAAEQASDSDGEETDAEIDTDDTETDHTDDAESATEATDDTEAIAAEESADETDVTAATETDETDTTDETNDTTDTTTADTETRDTESESTDTISQPPTPDEPSDGRDTDTDSVPTTAETSVTTASDSSPEPSATSTASATEQLAARSIPSVDPERTEESTHSSSSTNATTQRTPSSSASETRATQEQTQPQTQPTERRDERHEELKAELDAVKQTLEAAESDRDEARAELNAAEEQLETLRAENERLEAERDELQSEVNSLEARIEELESKLGAAATSSGPSLSAREALTGTNLFVRYESKGKTTVEDAHDGEGDVEALAANLRLDSHTRFDAAQATVDGQPYTEWLHETQQYRFAEWLVERLVFEIRDTGNVDGLQELYDTLPLIDRIEFDGAITVPEGEEELDLEFDIVCRNRMGDPLFAGNLDTSREPVTEGQMATLVQDAARVCETTETFAGGFFISAAFFEPEALETARDATSGSLLSRDSRISYVKQSRKRGYHLGLVESREEGFHLSVPDL